MAFRAPRCSLWPFDGELAELAHSTGVVVAEAYRMVGAGFLSGQSKRRQADWRGKADSILGWAGCNGVAFSASATAELEDGFGSTASGEDQFDAMLGLLKMAVVVEGRQPE